MRLNYYWVKPDKDKVRVYRKRFFIWWHVKDLGSTEDAINYVWANAHRWGGLRIRIT